MLLSKKFRTEDLQLFISLENKEKILEFVKERIFERYIFPVENVTLKYKNGFNILWQNRSDLKNGFTI